MTPLPGEAARRVTIGLPVYNGERFIRDALGSILAQTFRDFVLVVGDNASSDTTVAIVEECAAHDDRIVLLRSEQNRGAAWNYNRVFAECRTPYFKWAAADDLLAPRALECLVAALDSAAPSVVLAYPTTQLIDEAGQVVGEVEEDLVSEPGTPPYARMNRVVNRMAYGNCIFSLVRAEAMRRTRLHGNYPSADYVLMAEMALAGEFIAVPEPVFLRRLHEGTSMRANPTKSALTSWFDPGRRTVRHAAINLLYEYLRAVRHARLTRWERFVSYVVVVLAWSRRHVGFRSHLRSLLARVRSRA